MKIAPSLLAADFNNLKNAVDSIETADWLHLDVMDGHFVPNISFGPAIIAGLRPVSKLFFDVHLMISHPLKYLNEFAKAGADLISFHIECDDDTKEVIDSIKQLGIKAAVAVKPNTKIEEVLPYCADLDMVLIMTVEPGFGGQSMMIEQLEKARILKEKFPNLLIQADGGIGRANIEKCKEAGIDICVCGTSVFKASNVEEEINYLQNV